MTPVELNINSIVTLIAMLGSVLAVYRSFIEVGKIKQSDTIWRVNVDNGLTNILHTMSQLELQIKANTEAISKLTEIRISQQNEIELIKKELQVLTKTVDKLSLCVDKLREKSS